jgi:hypothetical protein
MRNRKDDIEQPIAASIEPAEDGPRWPTLVSRSVSPALLVLTLGLAIPACGPAAAEMIATPSTPPFTDSDRATIARNETLRNSVAMAPWLVYRVLRDLDGADGGGQPGLRTLKVPDPNAPQPALDPKRDPDLSPLPRASAEAAQDLFALIKSASATRPKQ